MSCFTDEQINSLRASVRADMSEKRFEHTAEVEKMAVRIGEIYAPDKLDILRVAAMLHDITKEKDMYGQLEILKAYGEEATELDAMSPAVLHSKTAALLIADKTNKYHEFAHPEVLSAVRNHTVCSPDMTLSDMLIYLADYIDMSRDYVDCRLVRYRFWDQMPPKMSREESIEHLYLTLTMSFALTINSLIEAERPISVETIATRNMLLQRLSKRDFNIL